MKNNKTLPPKNIPELLVQNKGEQQFKLSYTSMDMIEVARFFLQKESNVLLILESEEDAKESFADLRALLGKEKVKYLPPSFEVKQKKLVHSDINHTQRLQTIQSLDDNSSVLVVSSVYGVIEQYENIENAFPKRRIYKGQNLDPYHLAEQLERYGYERENFVYERGQFSLRGNILDVFSFLSDQPHRIEYFDDEIEEIRTFDIATQVSEDDVEEFDFSANRNIKIDSKKLFRQDVIESLKPHFIISPEESMLKKKINEALKETKEKTESDLALIQNGSQFIQSIEEIDKAILNTQEKPGGILASPVFHKNFNKIYQSLQQYINNDYTVVVASDDEKQFDRYDAIFQDLGGGLDYIKCNEELNRGFENETEKILWLNTHEIFSRRKRNKTRHKGVTSAQAKLLKELKELSPGDFVTHLDYGVGKFSGLEKIEINGVIQEAVRLIYANNDILYVHINSIFKISKYVGKDGKEPKVHKLGSDTWNNIKRKTKKKIKDIADDLIKLYAKRKMSKGFTFSPDTYLQYELESSFEFEDTPDQSKTSQDVKSDMEREMPMDRLVCGDVGFGKTEIAVRAAFKAVADSKQVAILVPTTLLAFQHYNTFSKRLKDFPCRVDYINRFRTQKEKTQIFKDLEQGKIDILIGTHAIVGKKVSFKDLGLLIVDEEQKFGVAIKDKLKEMKHNVDTLTLTATPIPRTLKFSLLGVRDYSLIKTPPPNRQPVYTEIITIDPDLIAEVVENEVNRGGQVFYVHNRIKDLFQIKEMLEKVCPTIDMAIAHGQMEGGQIEQIITDYINGEYDVLLSTNIVESGIDIPNANTMIISNAHQFGLSELHQLRGRVGRSATKAYCYLLAPPMSSLTAEARERLRAIQQNSDIGSGFNIALRDMDIRGAGNLLGGEQSGFISDIGYDTFFKILDEAIRELKNTEYSELYESKEEEKEYVSYCQLDTKEDMYIPDSYIPNSQDRMEIYNQMR